MFAKKMMVGGIVLAMSSTAIAAPSADDMWEVIKQLKAENQELKSMVMTLSSSRVVVENLGSVRPEVMSKSSDSKFKLSVGGFLNANIGFGERYGDAHENDMLSLGNGAISVTGRYEKVKGVLLIGGEASSENSPSNDGNIDVKDAYISIEDFVFDGWTVMAGAQPLLVGLKPASYSGERSLSRNIEYGGLGAFNFSRQGGAAITADIPLTKNAKLRVGIFDQKSYFNSANVDGKDAVAGSSFSDNYFAQLSLSNIGDTGLYGNAVVESRYVGGAVNSSEGIWAAGMGWRNHSFDASLEYVSLDQVFNETADDESYVISKFSFKPSQNSQMYFDYSKAKELDLQAYRMGLSYKYNKLTTMAVEYSRDEFEGDDTSSVDIRVEFSLSP